MVSSSSTKRAARLAQKGKGKKVRFQGGTLFPLIVLGVLVVGFVLIAYARTSRPAADASPPTVNDHWHVAYAFELCDVEGARYLDGAKEEIDSTGQLISTEYLRTGVHSHDDGVIHWHAVTSAGTGSNATLGTFLDVYEVELSDDELHFPDDQMGGADYVEGETKCGDEDGKLVVGVWDNFTDTGDPTIYTAAFDKIRVDQDSMVFVIGYIPENVDATEAITMPPWAADLPALGAIDGSGSGLDDPLLSGQTSPVGGAVPATLDTTAVSSDPTAAGADEASATTGEDGDDTATTAASATTDG
ncbi:MAG: hypothetical protein ACK5OX_04535 [Desertimonas sp.]